MAEDSDCPLQTAQGLSSDGRLALVGETGAVSPPGLLCLSLSFKNLPTASAIREEHDGPEARPSVGFCLFIL